MLDGGRATGGVKATDTGRRRATQRSERTRRTRASRLKRGRRGVRVRPDPGDARAAAPRSARRSTGRGTGHHGAWRRKTHSGVEVHFEHAVYVCRMPSCNTVENMHIRQKVRLTRTHEARSVATRARRAPARWRLSNSRRGPGCAPHRPTMTETAARCLACNVQRPAQAQLSCISKQPRKSPRPRDPRLSRYPS